MVEFENEAIPPPLLRFKPSVPSIFPSWALFFWMTPPDMLKVTLEARYTPPPYPARLF